MQGFDQEIAEYFAEASKMQGFDESMGKIVSILFTEPEEITLEDLAEKTGYSLASVSNKVKLLAGMSFVRKESRPGSKRIYVHMDKDFIQVLKKHLTIKQEMLISLAKKRLPEIIGKYSESAKTDKDRQKIKIIEDYYKQVLKAEKIIAKVIELINNS